MALTIELSCTVSAMTGCVSLLRAFVAAEGRSSVVTIGMWSELPDSGSLIISLM